MPYTIDQDPRNNDDGKELPATPYGPHPRGTDAAAGGADSSPLDNEPTGEERLEAAEGEKRAREKRGNPDGPVTRRTNPKAEQ